MSWLTFHRHSEEYASAAERAARNGDLARAFALLERAAEAESQAFDQLDPAKLRTRGITAVSAVALWYKSGRLEQAEATAYRFFTKGSLPSFAIEQIRSLLQTIWNDHAQREAGISFVPGQVVVSVKGKDIVAGGAPLDLILNKIQSIQSLIYRTAEYLKSVPLRRHGSPSKELQELCKPWLFQSVPGSYQFAVAIQKPEQAELFPKDDPEPEFLVEKFLAILKAASEDPEGQLVDVVSDSAYRNTFLRMTRNLAPTGKGFDQLQIRDAGAIQTVLLLPGSRKLISSTLRAQEASGSNEAGHETLRGNLRALHLDKDWLEVVVTGETEPIKVMGVRETVDDIIGPMVNHEVVVRVSRPKGKTRYFVDIELEE
jgi:hypothetical protein